MEELIYSIDWGQVKTAFDIFMWGDPNAHVIKALEPMTWVAIGSTVINAGVAAGQAIGAKRRRKEWLKRYRKQLAELDSQKITNPYENLVNPYEDVTVNQQQAKFMSQQQQQGLATTMRGLRPAAGTSGAAGLAQVIANQQTRNQQQISGLIGQQEMANQKMIAGGQMSIQMAEAQGKDIKQAREQQIALAKTGMAQAGFNNAQARADQAMGNVGYAVGQGVGQISSALQMESLNKEMNALQGQLDQQIDQQNQQNYQDQFNDLTGTGSTMANEGVVLTDDIYNDQSLHNLGSFDPGNIAYNQNLGIDSENNFVTGVNVTNNTNTINGTITVGEKETLWAIAGRDEVKNAYPGKSQTQIVDILRQKNNIVGNNIYFNQPINY